MKNIIVNVAIAFMLLLTQATSCIKPTSKNVNCTNNTMPLPQMAKDYFLFKNGSYWVYENFRTKELDSFYVEDFKDLTGDNSQFKYGKELNKCYENFNYSIIGKQVIKLNIGLYPWGPDNNTHYRNQTFFINEFNKKTNQLYARIYYIGDSIFADETLKTTILKFETLQLGDNIYKKIIQINHNIVNVDFAIQSLYAKNIGLIQFTTNENITWNLIRYNIKQ